MKQNKSCKRNVRKVVDATNDSNLSEDERQGYATIEEIRKGLFGFMPAITQHMHFPEREGGRCPVCGSKVVTSRIRRSWIIVDGPTYLEMKCGACGHTWRMLLRAGP